ncbi:MAG: cytochrome c [Phycisphaerales bacterium]
MKTTPHPSPTHSAKALSALMSVLVLGSALTTLGGCRGDRSDNPPRQFFPDMDDQQKIKPQSESEFFVDGNSNRVLVEGTVAFGSTPHDTAALADTSWAAKMSSDRAAMLKGDETFYFGLVSGTQDSETPQYVDYMPIELTKELLERGQERFNIYCSMCHGYDGLGGDSGTVGRLWSIAPANITGDPRFLDRSVESGTDGYLFHIVRDGLYTPDGKIRMPSYKHAVDEQDAWAIVAYLRVLQASHNVDPASLDSATRASIGAPPAAPETEMDMNNASPAPTDGGEG